VTAAGFTLGVLPVLTFGLITQFDAAEVQLSLRSKMIWLMPWAPVGT
jgi:hypothetical protein